MIGKVGERLSWIPVLHARNDYDDDDYDTLAMGLNLNKLNQICEFTKITVLS